MKRRIIFLCLILLLLGSSLSGAANKLTRIAFLPKGEEATVNITLPAPHNYNIFFLTKPNRMVVDFSNTIHAWPKRKLVVNHPLVKSIRSSQYKDRPKRISRVVIDLKAPAEYKAISQKHRLSLKISPKERIAKKPLIETVTEKPLPRNLVSLDFKDADIKVVIKAISELTGKNFVIDEKVRGKITIISPTKIPLDEVYRVLESILEVKGYTTVPAGKVIKVIPSREAKGKSIETRVGREAKRISLEDKIITQLIPLEYAASDQVRSLLTPLISPGGNLITYTPTNTIIITDVSSNIKRMMTIIEEIDRKPLPGKEMIHVYYLRNSTAADLAKVLAEMYAKMAARRVGKGKALAIEAKPTIVADKLTNSLIIIAAPTQYEELKKIIAKLDIPRQQVLVEALVAEISLEKFLNLGVEWASADELRPGKTHQPFAATHFGMTPELLTGTLYGMSLGMYKDKAINIGALVNLYTTDADVNILSTPYLLVNNNQEAEIKVGKRVPMLTASRVTEVDTVVKTYTYEDVGIVLRITPQINPEGFVTLKIHQEIQKVLAETIHDAPVLAKRETDTTVTVRDGQTIVIGGLLREDKSIVERRVPGLGRIPVLGWLFKRKIEVTEKISLVIFITPHVVTTPDELEEVTRRKRTEIEEFTK